MITVRKNTKKGSNSRLEDFFSQFPESKYKKRQIILQPNDEPAGVYFLKDGYVRMYSVFEDGRELTLNIFKPKTYFSMMWAIADIPVSSYFETMTPVSLQLTPKNKLLEFLNESPEILYDLTRRILIGLDGTIVNFQNLLSGRAYNRVIAALVLSAKRFGTKINNRVTIDLRLTHQDIASLAGITRETASLKLEALQKKSLISFKNHLLVISDLTKLQKEVYLENSGGEINSY